MTVRVGELAGCRPTRWAFCFEAIVAGTPLAGAALIVESGAGGAGVPRVRERFGDSSFLATAPRAAAPRCRSCREPS